MHKDINILTKNDSIYLKYGHISGLIIFDILLGRTIV